MDDLMEKESLHEQASVGVLKIMDHLFILKTLSFYK